jgi:hypothetical protein
MCSLAVRSMGIQPFHIHAATDEQVLEAMFLAASREQDSGIRVFGQHQDGTLRF